MLRFLVLLCAFVISSASFAQAERRIALVIGNSTYQNTPELKNPTHDAVDMAASLRRLDFEVFEGRDLDKRSMERMIRQFGVKLSGADLAVFFYAGHGVAIGGQNYLVPIDARLANEGDADFEGLALTLVLKQMEREAKTSIVLLDACRDNPLARNLARNMGTRSTQIGQGLAEVKTGVGTLIGFSTQPGNVATDGTGRNSPYAEALLRHMEVAGRDVSGLLIAVRNDVLKATDGKQVPWEHTSLTGQVYLKLDASKSPAAAMPPPAAGPNYDKEMEISFWSSVKDSKSPALIGSYVERYPTGTFAGLARVMVRQLEQEQGQSKGEPTGGRIASLPGAGDQTAQAPLTGDRKALARSLQAELKRVGCDPGATDGRWGAEQREALDRFARLAKVSLPGSGATPEALAAVSGQRDRICPLPCAAGQTEVDGKCVAAAKSPTKAERPQGSESSRRKTAAPRREAPASKGMCWAETGGRGYEFVPCNDARARQKAF